MTPFGQHTARKLNNDSVCQLKLFFHRHHSCVRVGKKGKTHESIIKYTYTHNYAHRQKKLRTSKCIKTPTAIQKCRHAKKFGVSIVKKLHLSAWWHQPCIDLLVPYFISFQYMSYSSCFKAEIPLMKFNDWIVSNWMCAWGIRSFCSFFKFHRFSSIYLLAGGVVCVPVCAHAVFARVCDAKVRRKMVGYNYILLIYFSLLIRSRAIFVLFCHYDIVFFKRNVSIRSVFMILL